MFVLVLKLSFLISKFLINKSMHNLMVQVPDAVADASLLRLPRTPRLQ
jgi:hypothetical protein